MTDIAEFLKARIAEDQAAAREAVPSTARWSVGLERSQDRRSITAHLVIPADSVDSSGIASDEVARTRWLTTAAHIARHDPARVLAECAAKRRIVELHADTPVAPGRRELTCLEDGTTSWPCDTLRLLALPYADHPDYREEWRP